jgi:alpha-galactosidase
MIKVAFLGAGSAAFAHGCFRQLMGVPEFRDNLHIAGFDINPETLGYFLKKCKTDLKGNNAKTRVTVSTDLREVLKDAKYVFSFVRPGGLRAMQTDIDIPLKYGVDIGPADTAGVSALMYAQRSIPVHLNFARIMREVSAPGALMLIYANPVSMNTWAMARAGEGIQAVGLCHGVEGSFHQMARAFNAKREEFDGFAAGVNHMTWFLKITRNGKPVSNAELLKAYEKHPILSVHEPVRVDILRRIGHYATESNGHTSDALPWYRKRPDDILNWIHDSDPLNGETGGILRSTLEGHTWWKQHFPKWLSDPAGTFSYQHGEHGPHIVEALETGRIYSATFNMMNNGNITNLPNDAIVESPGFVDRLGIHMVEVGALPLACAAMCQMQISEQRLAVEAAITGDDDLLRQAALISPLTGAVCNPPEVWQMIDELLVAQEQWLPQFKKGIAAAKKRLAKGPSIKTRDYKGSMRFKVRSLEEQQGPLIPVI